jgi:hypothetical protein
MSSAPTPLRRDDDARPAGLGTHVVELVRLLTGQKTRQQAGPTAQRMREGDPPQLEGDEPGRLVLVFARRGKGDVCPSRWAAGAFNRDVANVLSGRKLL